MSSYELWVRTEALHETTLFCTFICSYYEIDFNTLLRIIIMSLSIESG